MGFARIVRSNSVGRIVIAMVPQPFSDPVRYYAKLDLFDENGDKLKTAYHDDPQVLLKIGQDWLFELNLADLRKRNRSYAAWLLEGN